jgi:hypothetical protein
MPGKNFDFMRKKYFLSNLENTDFSEKTLVNIPVNLIHSCFGVCFGACRRTATGTTVAAVDPRGCSVMIVKFSFTEFAFILCKLGVGIAQSV